jgi:catechol 2,3-dioxygenase-like lactoylglutathione lyase family enzyme
MPWTAASCLLGYFGGTPGKPADAQLNEYAKPSDYVRAMVKTHGLTHIALAVGDLDRAARFYREVVGAVEVYRSPGFLQLQTPGSRDVIVLEQGETNLGRMGGVAHFGFRLVNPEDIHAAARDVVAAGGRVLEQGDFCPGEPYIFAADPDGYQVEIWYELPTPMDPGSLPVS